MQIGVFTFNCGGKLPSNYLGENFKNCTFLIAWFLNLIRINYCKKYTRDE